MLSALPLHSSRLSADQAILETKKKNNKILKTESEVPKLASESNVKQLLRNL